MNGSISFTPSGGTFSSADNSPSTYYNLTANGGSFYNFSVADYIYIVSPEGVYNELGQITRINSNDSMDFYSVQNIQVNEGDFIVGSSSSLTLKDIGGTYKDYYTQGYYNVEATGSQFLAFAKPQQYLFYYDGTNQKYVQMGQIFLVFNDTNVWLYDAPTGSVTIGDGLYTSYSENTNTANYADYIGNTNLYSVANDLPDWYVTSAGIMVDADVVNCLNRMRYEFLQEVMCGKCPEDYPIMYATYVGMLNAMEIQDWTTAVEFYNKLKNQCSENLNSSCGC